MLVPPALKALPAKLLPRFLDLQRGQADVVATSPAEGLCKDCFCFPAVDDKIFCQISFFWGGVGDLCFAVLSKVYPVTNSGVWDETTWVR